MYLSMIVCQAGILFYMDSSEKLDSIIAEKSTPAQSDSGPVVTTITSEQGDQATDISELMLASVRDELAEYLPDMDKGKEVVETKPIDVADIMIGEGVYFVHGLSKLDVPSANTILKAGTDWKRKLSIAVFLHPTLSCSSLGENSTVENMWAKIGILINGGEIESVAEIDSSTQATALNQRGKRSGDLHIPNREEVISTVRKSHIAIEDAPTQQTYNEITVANGSIAGFYVSLDSQILDDSIAGSYPSHQSIHDWVEDVLQMPVYVHVGSTFSVAHYNEETCQYEPVADIQLDPGTLADSPPYKPGQSVMDTEINSLMKNPPFKEFTSGLKEMSCARSYGYGAEMYQVFRSLATIDPDKLPKVLKIKTGRYEFSESFFLTGNGANPVEDYFNRMTFLVEFNQSMRDRLNGEGRTRQASDVAEELRNLVFHMYGFADQALQSGDQKSADLVKNLAMSVLTKDDAQALIARRVGEDGKVIMNAHDLDELSTAPLND